MAAEDAGGTACDADVLVVGAGPVGLLLAAELRRRGVETLLVEQRSEPSPLVRALGVSPLTLEVFDQLGLLEEAIAAGVLLRGWTQLVNGREPKTFELATVPSPAGSRPALRVVAGSDPLRLEITGVPLATLSIAQCETERILRGHLARHGGRIAWDHALVGFEAAGDRVVARVRTPDGGERAVACRWLVGCDGAHSAVRKGLGLEYEGDAFPMTYMLGDVVVDADLVRGFAYRSTLVVDGEMRNLMVAVPVPGDPHRYRLSMAAPPEYWEEAADLSQPPALKLLSECAGAMLPPGARIHDLRWSAFYRISHRIAPRYGEGRVFIAGDAAHIHPPLGGQGMNTGLQDAYNLAWKLALAVRGEASADLLASYDAERRPVGLGVVERATRRMEHAVGNEQDAWEEHLHDTQMEVAYPASAWVVDEAPGLAGVAAGERLREAGGLRHAAVVRSFRLHELVRGTEPTLLLYAGTAAAAAAATAAPDLAAIADAARARARGAIAIVGVAAPGASIEDRERFPVFVDEQGEVAAAYAGTEASLAIVVRPDGYVGYRGAPADADRVLRYLSRLLA